MQKLAQPFKSMSNIEYISLGSQKVLIDKILAKSNHFVIVDSQFFQLHKVFFTNTSKLFVLESSEANKTMDTVSKIIEFLQTNQATKISVLVAIGGGVVGDIVGFVAAIYMRGLEWINIPTTFLAQVDSSIGGKTAINFARVKNLIGAFHIPKQIVIDPSFLVTLSERDWLSGVGEVVKTALLNQKLYQYLVQHLNGLVLRDAKVITNIIRQCVDFKDKITASDLQDKNLRKVLNLGHTIGHALESFDEFKLSHGEYVLQGIFVESSLFAELCDQEYLTQIRDILRKLITTNIQLFPIKIAELALLDKKNVDDKIHFIVPKAVGEVTEQRLTKGELIQKLKEFIKNNENFIYQKF